MNKCDYFVVDSVEAVYQLQGCYDKFTIPEQWKQIQLAFKEVSPAVVDLSQVIECDSAIIALLVEIKKKFPEVEVSNAPDNLVQLLDLYQVKTLLF
ncbi:STAS domain-containing protein [Ignatzschineria sp. LJL83]